MHMDRNRELRGQVVFKSAIGGSGRRVPGR